MNSLTSGARWTYPGLDGMIGMGYTLVLDNQSVRAGKGLVERDSP